MLRRKLSLLHCLYLTLLFAAVSHGTAIADGWDWSAKAGLDYDFISNDYYLRTIDTLGLTPDSLLELKSISDRIDERGGFVRLDFTNKSALDFRLSNRVYLTNEKLRTMLDLEAGWGNLKFLTSSEFKSYNDQQDFSLYHSQFRNSSQLGLKLVADDRRTLKVSQEIEYVGYDQPDPTVTGYYQSESRISFGQRFGDFSDLDLSLRLDLRNNYDSSELNFSRIAADFGFSSISSSGYLSSSLYLEHRNYALPGSKDDYLYISPAFSYDFAISEKLNLAPELEMHYYDYTAEDFVTFSSVRAAAEIRLKYHYQLLSTFSIGAGGEVFAATVPEFAEQDYRSLHLLAGFETFSSSWLSLTFDGQLGRRNYRSSPDAFYTDYNFIRLDLLADIGIAKGLRLSLVGGTDFEYHGLKEDDVFVYMLSSTLTYELH